MKLLVIGSGGREHALCWRLAQSPSVKTLYCAPGNPGTARCATNVPIPASELEALLRFAKAEAVDLTVVGPEAPLCAGIADHFAAAGKRVFGPSAAAAQLEGSKAFAKQFMARHNIPTAPFSLFSDFPAAADHVNRDQRARVIKADGLAAGKGVVVAGDAEQARAAAKSMLDGAFGDAGQRIVIEHRLEGEEVSVIALCDGQRVLPLAGSQDHKARLDGDRGPNTGGMGAYSPAPILTAELERRVVETILQPTVDGMHAEGTPFRGVLYAGLMISNGAPSVIEFNCRFGDPETQPLMVRFRGDLAGYLVAAADGALPTEPPAWDPRPALCVVLTAAGYPGSYEKGARIAGLETAAAIKGVTVFHAGTADQAGSLVTSGGRVLGVTAIGDTLRQAHSIAYAAAAQIEWPGMFYRRDIGYRALGGCPQRGG